MRAFQIQNQSNSHRILQICQVYYKNACTLLIGACMYLGQGCQLVKMTKYHRVAMYTTIKIDDRLMFLLHKIAAFHLVLLSHPVHLDDNHGMLKIVFSTFIIFTVRFEEICSQILSNTFRSEIDLNCKERSGEPKKFKERIAVEESCAFRQKIATIRID